MKTKQERHKALNNNKKKKNQNPIIHTRKQETKHSNE